MVKLLTATFLSRATSTLEADLDTMGLLFETADAAVTTVLAVVTIQEVTVLGKVGEDLTLEVGTLVSFFRCSFGIELVAME